VSAEPLLGPIDFGADTEIGYLSYLARHNIMDDAVTNRIDWIIVGGESGPRARRMDVRWAREIRDQCEAFNVPFFFKQWGQHDPETFDRVGKKAAGRLLDGREHNAFPVTDVSVVQPALASHDANQTEATGS
jgi:protein gp37